MKEVKRERTAIKRSSHSVPYRNHLKAGRLVNKRVLDYGCGCGFDVRASREKGLDVYGYDKFQKEWDQLPDGKFDVITCNYVLNVIEDPEERAEVVNKLRDLADISYIVVRSDTKSIKESWEQLNDGYYTSNKTFQKIYTIESLKEEFGPIDIIESNNTGIMFVVTGKEKEQD